MKKVFIFDFDGTFYTGEDKFKYVPQYVDNHRREFLPNVTDEQYQNICAENPDFVKAVSGRDIAIQIYKIKNKYKHLKIDVSDFWQVQQDYVYDICLANAHFVDSKFIEQLCKRYSVYIVSNSSYNHIKHYMKILDIDYYWFKGVYSNKFEQFDQTKQHYYQDIINAENITPKQLYVFGDSVVSDLEPAKILGANAVFIQDAHDIKKEVEKYIGDNMKNIIKKYLYSMDILSGYENINNKTFDIKNYNNLKKQTNDILQKLVENEVEFESILKLQQEMEQSGELINRFVFDKKEYLTLLNNSKELKL